MAKFIELPYGVYNSETKQQERKTMLVNMERIISIEPSGEYSCRLVIAGGKVVQVYRRYDTLSAQLLHREVAQDYPLAEEIGAAYEEGYKKGIAETGEIKTFIKKAIGWMETHPLIDGWRKSFKKAMMHDEETGPEGAEQEPMDVVELEPSELY